MRARSLFVILSIVALSGCTVGPDHVPPQAAALNLPEQFDARPVAGEQVELTSWWASFGDPLLSEFVAAALAGNDDVAVAEARLRVARASVRGARGALLPSLDASASG